MIETLPPLLAAGVRYATAGLIMLGALVAYARVRRSAEPIERPTRAHWRSAFIVGTLLLLGGNGGVVLAELYIPSGIAAVLIATMPIWLALFDAILTRRRPSRLVIGGLIAGIVGVAILLAPLEELDAINPIGIGLCVLAEISWAAGSIYARRAPLPRSALLGTGTGDARRRPGDGPRRQPARRDRPGERRILLDPFAGRTGLPDRLRLDRRVHRLHLAPGQRAGLDRRDIRLRQPDHRGGPRRRHPQRADHAADADRQRDHHRRRRGDGLRAAARGRGAGAGRPTRRAAGAG